ncbi:hypothetical protein F5888DRAFT_1635647 [Russula emetica]|nr:hypothetical protein F5888DRAFT_1635647 [Russula emetica]
MDGATKTNPSDTPHILTAREEKKIKQSMAKEASVAEKHVAQAGKALRSAENDEEKAEKATRKAQQARDKTVKKERSTARALSDSQHKHDLAVTYEHKAANDLSMCQKNLQEDHRAIESRRTEHRQAQRKKNSGDDYDQNSQPHSQRANCIIDVTCFLSL